MTSAKSLLQALIVAAAKTHGGELPNRITVPRVLRNQLRLEMDAADGPLILAGLLVDEATDDNVTFHFRASAVR